jgi:heptosyltransferase-3
VVLFLGGRSVTPQAPQPKKILVVRLKAIGDVIMASPVLRALRKSFPSSEIHVVTRSVSEPMLRYNPNPNKILLYPEKVASLREKLGFFQAVRREGYDWVVDLEATPRSAWVVLATGAPVRVGYAFRVRRWAFTHPVPINRFRRFQGDVCLELVRHLGVPDDGIQTELFLGSEEKAWADAFFARAEVATQRHLIGLNPTGAWTSKQWPVEHWRRLIHLLNEQVGVKPLLYGGPGSEKLLQSIAHGLEERLIHKPETTLLQAAAFVARLDLLIGSDGTPQALGTPSLTMWGPAWGIGWTLPDDPRHTFIQKYLDCGPCDHTTCPYPEKPTRADHYYRECMDRISPEEVAKTAWGMMERLGKV